VTVLPESLVAPLREYLAKLFDRFERQRRLREPGVWLPTALARKYASAAIQWGWQWVFPANSLCRDPYTGGSIRHHRHEKIVQRAVQAAVHKAVPAQWIIETLAPSIYAGVFQFRVSRGRVFNFLATVSNWAWLTLARSAPLG
jgi:hypothetical protein